MNRRHYRKSNHRKRRIKNIIIISIAVALALFIIFLIIGLSLAEKKKKYDFNYNDFEYDETEEENIREVINVGAYPLPLLEDGSSFNSRLAGIKEDAKSVCISLNKFDGTLLFRSSLASSFSYLKTAPDAQNLANCVENITGNGLYVTATLYIPTFEDTDDDLKGDVELSIWGSVVCEAIRSGIGDVLLIANNATEEDVEKLCALSDRIHITEENAIIGLCLPNSVLEAEKSVSLIDKLAEKFDYLAFNATNLDGEGTILEKSEAAIAEMQLQLMYYKMRVLLPRGTNSEELDKLIEMVKKYSISSWQALPFYN